MVGEVLPELSDSPAPAEPKSVVAQPSRSAEEESSGMDTHNAMSEVYAHPELPLNPD